MAKLVVENGITDAHSERNYFYSIYLEHGRAILVINKKKYVSLPFRNIYILLIQLS